MPLVENKDFNALIDNKLFLISLKKKKNKKCMKILLKCKEMMSKQQEIY